MALTFDQPVAVKNFNGAALVVNYPVQSQKSNASGAPVVSVAVVQMSVNLIGTSTKNKLLLDATSNSGIASLVGVPWAGVADFALSNK